MKRKSGESSQVAQKKAKPEPRDKEKKTKVKTKKAKVENSEGTNKPNKKGKPTFKKEGFKKKSFEKASSFEKNKGKKFDKNKKQQQQNTTNDKPDWAKLKKEKKELRETRIAKRLDKTYDLRIKAKAIGEKLRLDNCKEDERKKLIKELHQLLSGNYNEILFAHDLSRVVQWLLKYSTNETHEAFFEEVKTNIPQMMRSKYAKNCVMKLLKYGSEKIKKDVLTLCFGHVVNLLSNAVSNPIVEYALSNCNDESIKLLLKQEFYGDLYKRAKDKNVKHVTDVYATSEGMKTATLTSLKDNLMRIVNKEIVGSSLVHTLLFEFLEHCSAEERGEMIVAIRNLLLQLSETKDGSKAGMICIWHGTNKDRKMIMKTIKDHVKDLAVAEHGHLLLLALADCVDDTVLLKKLLLTEVQNNIDEILVNEHGRKVILYLVARRDTHYFHPADIEYLQKGDSNETSKKPADIREKEILEGVIDPLLGHIASNVQLWFSTNSISVVAAAVLKAGSGENLASALPAIADFILNDDVKMKYEEVEYSLVEHPGIHAILKSLIKSSKEATEKDETTITKIFVEKLNKEIIARLIKCNRGCFLLTILLENGSELTNSKLVSKLNSFKSELKSLSGAGASILLKKLV